MAEISVSKSAVSEDELLARLTRPTTRSGGAGRQKSSHGYTVFKDFLESESVTQTLTYTNADDAKKARLSLVKEANDLNAERENAAEHLWVSPRENNVITLVDLGRMSNVEAQVAILTQQRTQQEGVQARMEGKYGKSHESVKSAAAAVKELNTAIKSLEK